MKTLASTLSLLLVLMALAACSQTIAPEPEPGTVIDDDDDDDASDDDDAVGDDDDSVGDDDDSVGDDDDSVGDDDDDIEGTPVAAGSVIVTEILNNPNGTDDGLEWIELFNTTASGIDLLGFTLTDDGSDSHKINSSVVIAPGGYLLLGQSTDANSNGGAPVAYAYGMEDFLLSNGGDEVVLLGPDGIEVDRVNYDEDIGFPGMSGFSMSLDPSGFSQWANDSADSWCDSPAPPFGVNGDHGTPLELNPTCDDWGGDDDDSVGDDDDDDTVLGPGVGDLIFTEIFQNPAGDDANREWVEVLNLTGVAVDLLGYTLADFDGESHEIAASLVVPAGGYVVLGASTDPALNDDAGVDYAWSGNFQLANGEDEVQLIAPDGTVVDEVAYDDGATFPDPNGFSMSLDLDSLDDVSNDDGSNWCESTSGAWSATSGSGSPGATNTACDATAPPVDGDGDGVPADQDCNDGNAGMFPGNTEIPCDGVDQDCSGADLIADQDGDGSPCDVDCNDGNAGVFPGQTEVVNGQDDDCDGQIDENATGCDSTETEPNNGWTNAEPMALDTVMCGTVSTAGDIDTFSYTIPEWTEVTFDVDADVDGSALDSELYFLGSNGDVILSNDDDGSSLDSLVSALVVSTGTFYAQVGDFGTTGSANHTYELSVTTSNPCDTIELEPNGSSVFADYMLIGDMACGDVSGSFDYDYFSFYVLAGTEIEFEINALDAGSGLGAQLELFDTDGSTLLADAEPGGFGDPELTYTFATTGTYYIAVAADLYLINSSGPYLLTAN